MRRKKENIEKATAKYENKTKDYTIITTSSSAITKKTCLKTIRGRLYLKEILLNMEGQSQNILKKLY